MKRLLPLATTCLTLWAVPGLAQQNVLLIIADDMGLDASACYEVSNQQAPMPFLEAMCAEGLVFENAYSAPVCSPTRATIMTGQYGFRTGVGAAIPRTGGVGLDSDTLSLFDVMTSTNYSANVIGKWHLAGSDDGLNHPADLGVPDYFGLIRGATSDYYNWTAVTDGAELEVDTYTTTEFTNRAIDWIGAQDDPWFLWLAHNAPHAPFHLPPLDLHSFDDLPDDVDAVSDNPLPYYQAMLEALDTEMARMMGAMSEEERANTIVMFVGDNGSPSQVASDVYGIHRAKGTLTEGGTHVPLIVWGPGVTPGRTGAFVNTTDIFATVAEIAGAQVDAPDSYSFLPVLMGGEGTRDYIHVEHFSDDTPGSADVYGWAVRQEDMKLVTLLDGSQELYDLANDPTEQINLLADGVSEGEAAAVAALSAIRMGLVAE